MDLNYLLHRHQTSLMRADAATCVEAQVAHGKLAAGYARQIHTLQSLLGARGALRA